ncbi:MAG: hypothetical protein BWY77_01124 [bacterium ADurb.Bin431]|nr:MAG: hypothetical protein BWY77_01124 [bacterium ADurb.Bin431]
MPLAIKQTGQEADRHGHRRGLFLLNPGQHLPFQPGHLFLGKRGIEHDIGIDLEGGIKVRLEGGKAHHRGVEAGPRPQARPEQGELLADLQGIAAFGALIHHVHGQAGGAEQSTLVGSIAGIHKQVHVDQGDVVALGEHDLEAVGEGRPLDGREGDDRRSARLRHLAAVDLALAGCIRWIWMNFEDVDPVGKPLFGGVAQIGGRGPVDMLEGGLVIVRSAAEDLVADENIGLAAKAANALAAADEIGEILGLDPLQLGLGGSLGDEFCQLLIEGLLDLFQILARLGRGIDREEPRDLTGVDIGRNVSGNLILIDQAFVESRGLAGGEDVADQIQVIGTFRAPCRHVPDLVDARLRHAVLGDLTG